MKKAYMILIYIKIKLEGKRKFLRLKKIIILVKMKLMKLMKLILMLMMKSPILS